MPLGDDKPKTRAQTQPGAPRRAQTQTSRDEEGFAALLKRNAGVPPIVHDEVTDRYERGEIDADELEQKRHERDARVRERLAVVEVRAAAVDSLRADLRTTDKLVGEHNTQLQIGVLPVIARMPRELEAIRTAQRELDTAFDSAITHTNDAIADMTKQLREHHERIEEIEAVQTATAAELADVKRAQAETARATAETSALAKTNASDIAKLKRRTATPSTDAKIGGWVRRNAISLITAAVSAIAGIVGGYLAGKLGITTP